MKPTRRMVANLVRFAKVENFGKEVVDEEVETMWDEKFWIKVFFLRKGRARHVCMGRKEPLRRE